MIDDPSSTPTTFEIDARRGREPSSSYFACHVGGVLLVLQLPAIPKKRGCHSHLICCLPFQETRSPSLHPALATHRFQESKRSSAPSRCAPTVSLFKETRRASSSPASCHFKEMRAPFLLHLPFCGDDEEGFSPFSFFAVSHFKETRMSF